jgi:hypothetical protein
MINWTWRLARLKSVKAVSLLKKKGQLVVFSAINTFQKTRRATL